MNARLREPITVRSISSRFINILLSFCLVSWVVPLYPPLFLSSLLYLIISPVPTCLVHNCETSRRSFKFPFVITFVLWSISFDPHQHVLGILLQWEFTWVNTKNISFLLRFLFNMFWLFFGPSPSVSSLLFDLSPQYLLF